LSNGRKLSAEIGEDRVDLWPYEALEFIDDLKRFQINYHQANFDRFHLIWDDCKRTWRFRIINLITGRFKVYAV